MVVGGESGDAVADLVDDAGEGSGSSISSRTDGAPYSPKATAR